LDWVNDLTCVGYGFTRAEISCGEKQTTNIKTTNPNQQKREISNKHRNTHPSKRKQATEHKSEENANAAERKKTTRSTTHHKKAKRGTTSTT